MSAACVAEASTLNMLRSLVDQGSKMFFQLCVHVNPGYKWKRREKNILSSLCYATWLQTKVL